jgi:hypothetical protein
MNPTWKVQANKKHKKHTLILPLKGGAMIKCGGFLLKKELLR